ncbi:MAG: hypothetical protein EOO45_11670 [Flavobacterium sp.]|nr:MAG: hypothetical protein EOO45_11670 [Flavobacterium sp.]
MKLSEIKMILPKLDNVSFQFENGQSVPEHFHVTEVGIIDRRFIDCGGTMRHEQIVNFQLWDANDFEHRLKPAKLLNIIALSQEKLGIDDHEVEVEYQGATIGRYGLDFNENCFVLKNKTTACLAEEACGITAPEYVTLSKSEKNNSCTPGGGCC